MRKTVLMAFGLILAVALSTSAISPAQAHIEEWVWLPPYVIRGYDSMFYREYIVGYEVGSTAILNVPAIMLLRRMGRILLVMKLVQPLSSMYP